MFELAYNVNGEPFEVPPTMAAWRVRKLKPKGAPEVVYGRAGAAPRGCGSGRDHARPGRCALGVAAAAHRAGPDVRLAVPDGGERDGGRRALGRRRGAHRAC